MVRCPPRASAFSVRCGTAVVARATGPYLPFHTGRASSCRC